uniref:von Willebrand factor A domain-containing protein 1 n=1 Tax=Erpetoichthys calabaricus TaxID=27687 RepID=A0A8C4RY17_ERPCA
MSLTAALIWTLLVVAGGSLEGAETSARPPVPGPMAGCCEGDVMFLVDSSGSVSSYEFDKVKTFLGELLHPYTIGSKDVQVSVLHVSTQPIPEFLFSEYTTNAELQLALKEMKQPRGDTNTGQAVTWAHDHGFQDRAGSRPGVPRVLVWVTDGMSSESVTGPMTALRDDGVVVLIVSTGQGNFVEFSTAVSPPTDKHLYFVDVDDLKLIEDDLRNAITDVIRTRRLSAVDITSHSARLIWPDMLSSPSDFYVLQYSPVSTQQQQAFTLQLNSGDTSALLTGLSPGTKYHATLIPESNYEHIQSLSVQFTTLQEAVSPTQLLISDSKPSSFRVSWAPLLPDSVQEFQVLFGPLPSGEAQSITVSHNQNSTVLQNLQSSTSYLVTVIAQYHSGQQRALSAKACTQDEPEELRLMPISPGMLRVDWDEAPGPVKGYKVRCRWLTSTSVPQPAHPTVHHSLPSAARTSLFKGPESDSVVQVCVSAMYEESPAHRRCRTTRLHPGTVLCTSRRPTATIYC